MTGKRDSDDIAAWMPPAMVGKGGSNVSHRSASQAPTARDIENLQKAAYKEGYEQGREAGQRYGHQEALEEVGPTDGQETAERDGQVDHVAQVADKEREIADDEGGSAGQNGLPCLIVENLWNWGPTKHFWKRVEYTPHSMKNRLSQKN